MFWVRADHPHHSFAVDDLALVAHLLYRSTYFHKTVLTSAVAMAAPLLVSVSYSSSIEIVGRQLNQHSITRKNADKMFAHFS